MESGAKGCEVVVSGKLRAARAKSMKFTDGFMIHSGQPAVDFVDYAVRHVMLRQGVLGIKVKMYVLHAAVPQASLLLTLSLQYERLGSRRPDWPTKATSRLRPNHRPTSGQDRVRAIFRTKGTCQHPCGPPSGGCLPATTARGRFPGGAVWRVCCSFRMISVYTLPILYFAYTQIRGVFRLIDLRPPPLNVKLIPSFVNHYYLTSSECSFPRIDECYSARRTWNVHYRWRSGEPGVRKFNCETGIWITTLRFRMLPPPLCPPIFGRLHRIDPALFLEWHESVSGRVATSPLAVQRCGTGYRSDLTDQLGVMCVTSKAHFSILMLLSMARWIPWNPRLTSLISV